MSYTQNLDNMGVTRGAGISCLPFWARGPGTENRTTGSVRLSKIFNYLADNASSIRLSDLKCVVNDKERRGTSGTNNTPRSRKARDLGTRYHREFISNCVAGA